VALRVDDVAELDAVSDAMAAAGYHLFAAEVAAQGADAARRRADQRRATALSLRSAELQARCEDAATPALARSATVTPLTAREREIALMVAKGASNKEIGAQLYLSVRTVENHVRSVLLKLGVARRTEVGAALGR
jgi:DNA-binding NarL/FixJ family response regulator